MTSNIPTLLCSKFQGALYIEFDSVNVGSSHTRLFKLQNPNKNKSVTVSVDRVPDKKGFSVTLGDDFSQSIEIEANGYVFAHVLWCPLFNMAIRESAYLKVDNLPVLQITLHGIAGARNNNTTTEVSSKKGKGALLNASASVLGKRKENINPLNTTMKSQLGNTSNVSVMSSKSSLNATLNGHDKTSLTSSVDAHWIEAQTSGFIDWINFIFASHLTFNDHDEIVGMVVNDDDFLHSTYHIFDVPYISKLPPSMIAQIETDEISIRDDQNIFVDVGLQKILLNILFSYELPWLRLGIEAVLRSEGDALSEDDMHLLSDQVYSCVTSPQKQMNFIKSIIHERFIKDPSILLKYSKQKPLNFQLEAQMHTQMRRQFIKKIFSLIKFLDIARMKQALKLPRLFRADATVKSSQDVLISICKELLRAEGDYLHHLSSVGYKVAFKQSYVDEFDYQVKNLSVDMHDGVRLTKLVSLVADHDGLCDHLRVPAVSRLQKVHNIVTALESLHSSGESIFADLDDGLANESVITARSSLSTINGVKSTEDRMQAEARRIVDGNTEAILVLLWRIMFAFNLRDMIDEPLLLKEVARVARGAVVKGDPRDSLSSVVVDPAVSEAEKKMSPYLMYWCNAVLNLYDITIDDFTTSLADGSVLCLLVHYYHPDLLPLKSINQSYKLQSLDDAKITDLQKRNFVTLRRACKTIGGIPVLSKDYSVQDPPDSQSMTFFLAYLFSRLMACAQTKAAIRIQRVFKLKYASVLVKLRKDKKVKKKPSRFGRTNFLVTISASKHHAAQVIQSMFLRFMQRRRLAQLRTLQSEQASHPEELDDINNSLRLTSFAEECDNSTVFELLPLTKIETETPLINLPDTAVSVTDDYLLGLSSDGTSLPVPVSVRKALGERDMNADSSFADPQTPFGTAQKSHISFFSPEKAANLSFIEKKRRTRSLLASPLFDKENSFAQTPLMVASVDTSEIEDRYRREMESKLKQTAAEMEESLRSQFMTESMVTDGLLKSEREARMTAEMQVKLEAEKRLALERRLQEFENERYEAELRAAREKEEASLRQQKEAAARTIISTQLLSFVHRRRFTKTIHVIIRLQAVARSYLARRKVNTVIRGICKLQLLIKQRLSTRHRSMQHNAATSIQACCRRLLAQKIALSMKQAVIILQSRIRAHLAQVQYRITRQACIRIQSVCRGFIQRSVKKRALAATLLLQGCIRVYLAKKELATRKAAVVTLQACCFRFIQMKRNNAAHTAQQQARLKRRVHILRAAAIIVGVCRAWVRRKRVARAAMRIAVWYQAYLPLLKARKLRKGILRLQGVVRSVITAARQTDEVRACRVRILAAEKRALADPTQRLSSQVYTALCACEDLAGTPLSDLMTHCHKIYFATEYVKPICSWFVEPRVLSVFIALMKSCTRTLPHQQLLCLALCVVLNVTYHNDLCNTIADEEESVDLLVDVLQMFRDIGPVFCLAAETLCRLIESHKQLKDEMTGNIKEHRKRLEGIHQLLERKSRLEARVRLVSSSSSLMNTTSQHILLADINQVMPKEESAALSGKLRFKSDNASLLYIKAITNLINGSS